jgi:hypothetical protein
MNIDFEPNRVFSAIDSDNDGQIDSKEILQFLKKHFVKLSSADAELIVKEFDADCDGYLNFDEFCKIFLPSTNSALRDICHYRSQSFGYNESKPLKEQTGQEIAEHLENEVRFLKKRNEIKKTLLKRPDFIKANAFSQISLG